MWSFLLPAKLILRLRVRKGAKNLAGKCPPPDSRSVYRAPCLRKNSYVRECEKISPIRQLQIADSSSRNAVCILSARTEDGEESLRKISATGGPKPLPQVTHSFACSAC